MKKYDVIIVGCGPAGSAAAKILSKNNINFCMIDKQKFPREKLCGGGLTNKSVNLLKKLNFSIEKIDIKKTEQVEIIAKNIKKELNLNNNIIMIDRIEFDYNILKQVINNNLFEEENIINVEGNILKTNKNEYEFKYIIFADGVNGYSRKLIENRNFGFCVEYNSETLTNRTILDFGIIDGGYGWIFPKSKHTTIGLGIFSNNKNDYINLLVNLAKKNNFEIDKTKIKGYHIPIFSKKTYEKSVIDNKIIVGDAAALVDPISGEGIYYALASGMYAAESIIECFKNNSILKDIYFKKTENLCKSLEKRLKASKLLYSPLGSKLIKIGLNDDKIINELNRIFG